jgi:PAS domain S-box-containing protein
VNISQIKPELSKGRDFLSLIGDCAKRMCQGEGWFDEVMWVLERLGKELALDRVYLAKNLTGNDLELQVSIQREWKKSGWIHSLNERKNKNLLWSSQGINHWWGDLASKGLSSTNIKDFPQEAWEIFGSTVGGTLFASLLVVEGKPWGFLACYKEQSEYGGIGEETTALKLVAEIIAASIERSNKFKQRTRRRERLAELVEEIPEIFWEVEDNRPKLIYASLSFERMWGYSQKEAASNPLGFLKNVPSEEWPRAEGAFDLSSLQNEVSIHEEQFHVLIPGGKSRWISMRYSTLGGKDKGAGLVMGLATDITAHKQREMRWLTQRESLICEVNHRIKNHLQGVVGLLQQHIYYSPELAQPIHAAISQITAVATIHGLQALHKGGQIKLEEMVEAICHNTSKINNCPIHFEIAALNAPVIIVEQEAVPIALIVNELVFNACKHRSSAKGKIQVGVTENVPGKSAELLIRNGEAQLNKEFDFASGQGLGTGLGLVKSLLPPVGAKLTIEEREKGVEAYLELSSPVLQLI